ncbi:hypothetical protein [Salimicrobium flavidum]|uniref:Uncharacterized protein n=1 Tax=Salimicrobium flavidum TaxID=570947 RepID=A0A1N7INJ1_9BACI|nr:hypothetical protein [Salimicrobium flavidum]SIS38673.1 hypothetical protein SAMN05421687_101647 [Salimicrobium flavidum]
MLKVFDYIILPLAIVAIAVSFFDMPVIPALIGAYIGIWIALFLRRKKEEKRGGEDG